MTSDKIKKKISDDDAQAIIDEDTREQIEEQHSLDEKAIKKLRKQQEREVAASTIEDLTSKLAMANEQLALSSTSVSSLQISNFGYSSTVVMLDSTKVLSADLVKSFCHQFRNSDFKKSVSSCISIDARRLINMKLRDNGFVNEDSEIDLWTDAIFLLNLEKAYKDTIVNETSFQALRKLAMHRFYDENQQTLPVQKLMSSLLEICENMTQVELNDRLFQKSCIDMIWNLLDNTDALKINLDTKVKALFTMKNFIYLIGAYRSDMKNKVVFLEENGYAVAPRVYKLKKFDQHLVMPGDDEKKVKGNKKRKLFLENAVNPDHSIDVSIDPCYKCGRQMVDKFSKETHTSANCYLNKHENCNRNPNISWKESKEGKAFAAMTPPLLVLPYGMLMTGAKRIVPKKSGEFIIPHLSTLSYVNCDYLTALSTNLSLYRDTYDFLPLLITQVQASSRGQQERSLSKEVEALLDSGSLAGDFISQEIVNSMNCSDYIIMNNTNNNVCSGLDSTCSKTLGSIELTISFKN